MFSPFWPENVAKSWQHCALLNQYPKKQALLENRLSAVKCLKVAVVFGKCGELLLPPGNTAHSWSPWPQTTSQWKKRSKVWIPSGPYQSGWGTPPVAADVLASSTPVSLICPSGSPGLATSHGVAGRWGILLPVSDSLNFGQVEWLDSRCSALTARARGSPECSKRWEDAAWQNSGRRGVSILSGQTFSMVYSSSVVPDGFIMANFQ